MMKSSWLCNLCRLPFTDEEWDIRHSDEEGEDIHERCCEEFGPCSDEED